MKTKYIYIYSHIYIGYLSDQMCIFVVNHNIAVLLATGHCTQVAWGLSKRQVWVKGLAMSNLLTFMYDSGAISETENQRCP